MKRKIMVLLVILSIPLLMGASYNYSYYGEYIHSSPGYNYITHFDQQNLTYEDGSLLDDDDKYVDPQDVKVFGDNIYLLARTTDRKNDILLVLDKDFNVVETHKEFELTDNYEQKVLNEVNNTFDLIEDLYLDIFENNVFYPGGLLPINEVHDLVEVATFEWESVDTTKITNTGHVFNYDTENTTSLINLEMSLWGETKTVEFEVQIGTEYEGIEADANKVFSFKVEDTVSIDMLNEAVESNFDTTIYTNIQDIIEVNREMDEEGKLLNEFTYEGYSFSFKDETDEFELEDGHLYKDVVITLLEIESEEDTNEIHGSMFDEIYITKSAKGIEVVESGVYIADTDNSRIIKLDFDFEVKDAFFGVDDDTFKEHEYKPLKLTVDSSERMYVVADGVFEGIIELDSNGDFNRYTGVNPIKLTPLEILRRFLMTETQKKKLQTFLPTNYTNVSIDDKSFIFATAQPREGNAEDIIQLINPKGIDVLKRNGYHNPMADILYVDGKNNYVVDGPSNLVDVAIGQDGIYSVLDAKRSRIFTYDREGNLLYINGDKGSQSDKFRRGIALEYLDDNMVVLDEDGSLIVYRPTEFGETVNKAVAYHSIGEFELSANEWEKVLRLNTNYEIAYNGIGKYNLREGNYKEAMKNFKLGHDRYYYSKAFKEQRNIFIKKHFSKFVLSIVVVVAGFGGYKIYKKYRKEDAS